MITAVVNTATYIPFTLLDSNGDPVTGKVDANFTKKAKLRNVGTETTPTVTEDEDGVYDVIVTFPALGIWHLTLSVEVDGETVRYEETVQAFESLAAIAFTRIRSGQTFQPGHLNTLQQAIEMLTQV